MQEDDSLASPTGWFQIAWSDEIVPGSVHPMHYFGQDLVCYRTESGHVRLSDAFCPHRGAHLGHGGVVSGEDIECPFHGWRWSATGHNTLIPDVDRLCADRTLRTWHVLEHSGVIMAWHDVNLGAPGWEPPALTEHDDPSYYPAFPHAARKERLNFPPQLPLENVADLAHVKFVHRWPEIPSVLHVADEGVCFRLEFEGPMMVRDEQMTVNVRTQAWGAGLLYSSFTGLHDSTQLVATTPIDGEWSTMFHTVWTRRMDGDAGDKPTGLAAALVRGQFEESFGDSADRPIFENQRYVHRPPFVREEGRVFTQLRRWSKQFYPNGPSEANAPRDGQRDLVTSGSGGPQ